MAKVSDTRDRQRQLTEALFTIAASRGLEEVSFREVASEAGVAVATVQYYFRTKEGMLTFAYERMVERLLCRIHAVDTGGTVGQVTRRVLQELLPLDEQRTAECRVYLAFASRAPVSAEIARVHSGNLVRLRSSCARAIRTAREIGEAPASLDPEREAAALVSFVDGLTLHATTDPWGLSPEEAASALEAYLDRILDVRGERNPGGHERAGGWFGGGSE